MIVHLPIENKNLSTLLWTFTYTGVENAKYIKVATCKN